MKIEIVKEAGIEEALLGLGLSFDKTADIDVAELYDEPDLFNELYDVSLKLYNKDGGHNKFLESIMVWIDLTTPRYMWSEIDTYRISTKQSQSTMHTILRKPLSQDMFEQPIPNMTMNYLEQLRQEKEFELLKNALPEGFLQRRIWVVNYKVLRNVLSQRKNHKLKQWKYFCSYIYNNIEYPAYFNDIFNK